MKLLLSYILFSFLVFSCKPNKEKTLVVSDDSIKTSSPIIQKSKMNVKGLTLKEAITKYGEPQKKTTFELNAINLNEFRIELNNFFDNKQLKSKIDIKEITWKAQSDSVLTSWYKEYKKEWIYVHHIMYHKNDEF